MMKIIFSVMLVVFSFALSMKHTLPVYASCLAQTLEEQKERADIIVTGKASAVDDLTATIQVDRYFKGHGGPSAIVLEKGPDITSVDLFLEEGKDYLLYLRIDNNSYKTDLCMGSREVSNGLTTEETAVLGNGYEALPDSTPMNELPKEEPKIRNINMFFIAIITLGLAVLLVYVHKYPRKKRRNETKKHSSPRR